MHSLWLLLRWLRRFRPYFTARMYLLLPPLYIKYLSHLLNCIPVSVRELSEARQLAMLGLNIV
jgi:hypothetical protein